MLKLKPMIHHALLVLLVSLMLAPAARAGMVNTPDLLVQGMSLPAMTGKRELIEQQLVELGVDAQQAAVRVAALSDDQVTDIAGRLDQLPAGGDGVGILLTIFIVFVITDVIGATDIFPFIKPVR